MLRVIRQLWVFSRFISEIQNSPAAPGYRQRRHKRKNSGHGERQRIRTPGKEKAGVRRTLLQAEEVKVVPRISTGTLNAWKAECMGSDTNRLGEYLSLEQDQQSGRFKRRKAFWN